MITASQTLRGSSQTYLSHRRRLIALAMSRGFDEHEAEDAVQDLFAALVRVDRLEELEALPEQEQAVVLACRLKSLLMNRRRDSHRLCRATHRAVALADLEEVNWQPTHEMTPAVELARAWALGMVSKALRRLRTECGTSTWSTVAPALRGEPSDGSARCRVAVHRARRRLGELMPREEVRAVLLGAC